MPSNGSVIVKLTVANDPLTEVMRMEDVGSFVAGGDGWLPKKGGWMKTVNGTKLTKAENGKGELIGVMLGFNFRLAKKPDNGRFLYDGGGGGGMWYVIEAIP